MANPLVIGALLVAGAGTIYLLVKKPAPKKKKKASASKWHRFGDKCQALDKPERSDEEAEKFLLVQLEAFGGLAQLGDPPGNIEANLEFTQGFARHLVEQMVSPVCRDRIRQVGATMPPDLVEFQEYVLWAVDGYMTEEWGYETGFESEGAVMGPSRPSLVDAIRGVVG